MGDTYAHPAVRHRLHPAARDARGSSRCKDSGQQHVPHDTASPPTRSSQTTSIITKLWPENCFDPAMNDRVLPDRYRLLCLGVPMATARSRGLLGPEHRGHHHIVTSDRPSFSTSTSRSSPICKRSRLSGSSTIGLPLATRLPSRVALGAEPKRATTLGLRSPWHQVKPARTIGTLRSYTRRLSRDDTDERRQ